MIFFYADDALDPADFFSTGVGASLEGSGSFFGDADFFLGGDFSDFLVGDGSTSPSVLSVLSEILLIETSSRELWDLS